MKKKRGKSHLRLRLAIVAAVTTIWLLIGSLSYINSPKVQSIIFASINKVSSLKIESARLHINFPGRKMQIEEIRLFNPKKNQRFTAGKASFKFKVLPLFKGSLKLSDLKIDGLKIEIGDQYKKWEKERPRIGLANLLLLRNLAVKNGSITNIEITTPKITSSIDRIGINFIPSIFGKIRMSLNISSPSITTHEGGTIAADNISIAGGTDINNWIDIFPYVDDLSGNIKCAGLKWERFDIDGMDARLEYSDRKLDLHSLTASINGAAIEVKGKINGNNGKYNVNVNIPNPVYIPSPERETSFTNISGSFSGTVHAEGQGLNYKTTKGTVDVEIKHRIGGTDPLPAALSARFDVADGRITTSNARLAVSDQTANISGSFNYINPDLDFSFEGKNIRIESVMNRFRTKHYHPTKGLAAVSGTFSGWKPNLKFTLSVEAKPAGYYNMAVERAHMDMELTYHELHLSGEIYQGDKITTTVDLDMKLGAKLADGTRQKTFDLNIEMNDHNLDPSMTAYGIEGAGTGKMHLTGSPKNFTGEGHALINNGSVKGIGFSTIESDISLAPKKVTFSQIKLATTETNPYTFQNPVQLDVIDSGVRVHGTPRNNLSIDAKYISGSGQWQIAEISYASLAHPDWTSIVKGTVGSGGALNLFATGIFDTALLSSLRGLIREAEGPAELRNIHITGTSENPALTGSILLHDNTVSLRNWGYFADKISGVVNLSGHTISIPALTGRIEYGDFKLNGTLTHNNKEISKADLSFDGKSIMYASKDRSFRMETDCDLKLTGGPSSSLLQGEIKILDGRYTKKFSIFEKMKAQKPEIDEREIKESEWKGMKLGLKITSPGDITIDNNIGKIWLNADLMITGTEDKPKTTGSIETTGGEIRYAGLDFDVNRGYVELHDRNANPYVEFTASKEVSRYNVVVTVKGQTDKLYVDLSSTPPLDRKDILALLTFGVTEEDMRDTKFGVQFGAGLVAEQVASLMEQPVRKFTPLDTFRIEASPTGDQEATRLYLGKDISDRLKINFITDINSADAQQMFMAEYLITDFLLLKGFGSTNDTYTFNLAFRFREQ